MIYSIKSLIITSYFRHKIPSIRFFALDTHLYLILYLLCDIREVTDKERNMLIRHQFFSV
jgi:hypothetical protein